MADYGFVHNGEVYTPNGTSTLQPEQNADRNAAIEAAELDAWLACPDVAVVYYNFPQDTDGRHARASFFPQLTGQTSDGNGGTACQAIVTTWLGTKLGIIIRASVYQHNFGGRMVSMRVRGTNGAVYFGRASYGYRNVIGLRLIKSKD